MPKSYFYAERIRLRTMEPEDVDVMYDIENDLRIWEVTNLSVPYSKFALRQYIENTASDLFADGQLRLMIVRCEDDAVIGTIDITDFVPIHAHGEVGIAVRKEFRNNGYAKEALQLLCNYAFNYLHMKQLTVHVATDNQTSFRLFQSCGFTVCGILKEWWRVGGGGYKDVALLQRLRED